MFTTSLFMTACFWRKSLAASGIKLLRAEHASLLLCPPHRSIQGLPKTLSVSSHNSPGPASAAILWNLRQRWERIHASSGFVHALSTVERTDREDSDVDEDLLEPLDTSCAEPDPFDDPDGKGPDVGGAQSSLDEALQSINFDDSGAVEDGAGLDFVLQSFPGNRPSGSIRPYSNLSESGGTAENPGRLGAEALLMKSRDENSSQSGTSERETLPGHDLETFDLSSAANVLEGSDTWDSSFSALDSLLQPSKDSLQVGSELTEILADPQSRKRQSEETWGLENTNFKRARGEGNLHDDIALQKDVAARMKADAPHKHDLSFLDPIDINKESEHASQALGEDLWLFDEREGKDDDIGVFRTGRKGADMPPKRRDFAFSKRKSAAQTKKVWSKTYAGQGAFIKVDSMLGLVERKIVRMVRDDLLDCLVAESGQDSPSATFTTVMRESTVKNKNVGLDRLDKLCVLLQERLPHLTPEELAITLLCMARVGYRNDQILREVWMHIISSSMLGSCSPRVFASLTLASGLLNHLHMKATEAVELEVLKIVESPACFSDFNASAFTGLLYGCSLAWSKKSGRVLVGGLVGCECSDDRFWHRSGWIDLASMLSLSSAYDCTPRQLVAKLHSKIIENCDQLGAPETVLILQGLQQITSKQRDSRRSKLAVKCIKSVMKHVQSDQIINSLESGLVPDLVHALSFLDKPDMKLMRRMSLLLAKEKKELPMWILIRKVLEGYSRLSYVDDDVFQVLNASLLSHGFTNMHVAPLAKVLMSGWSLQALNDTVVSKIVLALHPENPAWNRCTPLSAAKIAWGLAAWRKLTPEILTICAERCKEMKSLDQFDPATNWNAESSIAMRGLFTGYHYVQTICGVGAANACFPGELLHQVLKFTELIRLEAVGKAPLVQRQISEELHKVGLSNTLKPLLGKALYEADIALHDKQVVLLVDKPGARSINEPFRLLGPALLRQQQLEDLNIKVVRINEVDWKALAPDERGKFLETAFDKEGIVMKKLISAAKRAQKRRLQHEADSDRHLYDVLPRWVEDRMLVTQDLGINRLKGLVDTRGIFTTEEDEMANSIPGTAKKTKRKPRSQKKKRSKVAVVSAVVAHEACSLFRQIRTELDS